MKKLVAIFLFLALVVSGCNFPGKGEKSKPVKPKTSSEKPQQEPKQEPPKEQRDYYFGYQTPVKGVKEWVERYQNYEGVFEQKMEGYRVLLFTMGEKLTGGYQVKVKKFTRLKDKWVVVIEFKEPDPNDMTTQVVNSPYELLSIKDDGKPIEVLQYTGHTNPPVPMEVIEIPEGKKLAASKSFIVFSPLEGEKILKPVTIRGKARVFEANFRIHIEDGHNYLAEKIITADKGAPDWGGFEVELPFVEPTNPQAFIIFSYENMENGQMIEELILPVKF